MTQRYPTTTMEEKLQKTELVGGITFTPPLYKQRYLFVKQLVSRHKPKKVADLGCADCRLLWLLKFCCSVEELVGVDISEDVMKQKMHTLSPIPGDYLQPSEKCLTITLYQGSVTQKDPCMLGFDMITCIELIEHLEAKELETFPEVVFGFMSPAMIVISTPNSEFNPLLPTETFRHPDHKFEWNRAQFQNWSQAAAARYNYTVEFTGLGAPPPGKEVGFCTQIGVFMKNYRKTDEHDKLQENKEHVYKTVFRVVYPSLKDEKYLQNAVVGEVIQKAQIIARRLLDHRESKCKMDCDDHFEEESRFLASQCVLRYLEYPPLVEADKDSKQPFISGNTVYIPLRNIFSFPKVNQLCGNMETLKKLIIGKVALSNDGSAVLTDIENEDLDD
uniref:Small RNA 2'-O-methyltransferase n=1 Tax=Salvator merianae TaxID=96440 RepID=A0A8D0CBW6_SALMN